MQGQVKTSELVRLTWEAAGHTAGGGREGVTVEG